MRRGERPVRGHLGSASDSTKDRELSRDLASWNETRINFLPPRKKAPRVRQRSRALELPRNSGKAASPPSCSFFFPAPRYKNRSMNRSYKDYTTRPKFLVRFSSPRNPQSGVSTLDSGQPVAGPPPLFLLGHHPFRGQPGLLAAYRVYEYEYEYESTLRDSARVHLHNPIYADVESIGVRACRGRPSSTVVAPRCSDPNPIFMTSIGKSTMVRLRGGPSGGGAMPASPG